MLVPMCLESPRMNPCPCATDNSVTDCARSLPRCVRYRRSLPWIAAADDMTFADIVSSAPVPVLVDIGDRGEGNERVAGTVAGHLAIDRADVLKLVKLHNEASADLVRRFACSSPTLLPMDHGRLLPGIAASFRPRRCAAGAVGGQRAVSASPPIARSNTGHNT